jgi:hypothetical protein
MRSVATVRLWVDFTNAAAPRTGLCAALEEYTRERVPLDWAASLGNQGVTLTLIADRTNYLVVAETGVRQIETAYETLRSGGQEQWAAYFEAQPAKARAIRDRRKGQ